MSIPCSVEIDNCAEVQTYPPVMFIAVPRPGEFIKFPWGRDAEQRTVVVYRVVHVPEDENDKAKITLYCRES